jgi:hypothetical protein
MTEQSQMPLVGPLKRRGWREIVWFRPLTSSTHTALVVTRRGRLTSILPAGGPRTFSDYLAWPYDFREVDTRERLLMLEQRLESFDSAYEFCVALRLVYQVLRAERAALEFDDVQAELAHAVVQSLRLSGRSFGIEQDKTLEEHLQETLIHSDALVQRIQALGLVLRRADVTVTLDEHTRAHAEALRFSMRERALHFQVAVESLEPDRSFDVHVGGAFRLTDRRAPDGPSDSIESAIQMAITRTLRRVGITFAPSDYSNAAKAMAEMLRKDTLLQSELSVVQAQLLRPTVQIQPDHSMVHVPRPTPLSMPDPRSDPMLRRLRQGLPRVNRPPALLATSESESSRPAAPAPERRALPPPEQLQPDEAASQTMPLDNLPADGATSPTLPLADLPAAGAASPTLPLSELPASNDELEGDYTLWPLAESQPVLRTLPHPGQADDDRDERAPWADLIASAELAPQDLPPSAPITPAALSEPVEPLPWESAAAAADEPEIASPAGQAMAWSQPVEPLPWESVAAAEPALEQPAWEMPAAQWPEAQAASLGQPALEEPTVQPDVQAMAWSQPVEPLPWESVAAAESAPEQPVWSMPAAQWPEVQPASEDELAEPLPWDSLAAAELAPEQPQPQSLDTPPAFLGEPAELLPWDTGITEGSDQLLTEMPSSAADAGTLTWSGLDAVFGAETPIAEPDRTSNELPDDLGFTLDWSEPESAATVDGLENDVGSSLAWSESQPERFAGDPSQGLGAPASGDIVTAHWDDALIDPAAATLFGDMIVQDSSAGAATTNLQSAPAFEADLPAQPEQGDEQPLSELQASPWYTPTAYADEQLPFDTDAGASPIESYGATWPEALVEQPTPIADATLGDVTTQLPIEAADLVWDEAWIEPNVPSEQPVVGDATAQALPEAAEPAWADVLAEPHLLAEQQAEPAPAIPDELITRMIGMIQSYGPAWFKMWSLELKERPERLPVVLGEVTADQTLLAQASELHVQSALLRALAAYSAPTFVASRLATPTSLPSPALVASSSEDEDAVPDWLSLRAKWNGNGGGR